MRHVTSHFQRAVVPMNRAQFGNVREVDEVLGRGFAVVHQDDDIGAAGDECTALLQFRFETESFLDVLRLVKHGAIMSTNLLTGKSQKKMVAGWHLPVTIRLETKS